MGNIRREKQKMNKKREEYLDSRNAWGHKDSTPAQAVVNIIEKKRSDRS